MNQRQFEVTDRLSHTLRSCDDESSTMESEGGHAPSNLVDLLPRQMVPARGAVLFEGR